MYSIKLNILLLNNRFRDIVSEGTRKDVTKCLIPIDAYNCRMLPTFLVGSRPPPDHLHHREEHLARSRDSVRSMKLDEHLALSVLLLGVGCGLDVAVFYPWIFSCCSGLVNSRHRSKKLASPVGKRKMEQRASGRASVGVWLSSTGSRNT